MPYKVFSFMVFLGHTSEELPEGSILSIDKSMLMKIGIQWFNIIVLTIVLIVVLYKPVKKYMHDRMERIKNDIESARQNNEMALELKVKYEGLIKNIEKERDEILNHAYRTALEKREKILLSAREDANSLLKKAEDDIETERENIAEDIKLQIIELSTLVASRFVELSIDKNTQDRYIEEALADWSKKV